MSSSWPFEGDAAENDPLTELRIPVVNSFNPKWYYIAAYLDVPPSDKDYPEYLRGEPLRSNQRPTDVEALMLSSFIKQYINYWYRESFKAKLARRQLDVDGGCNTTVFIKYGTDDWAYRRVSWRYGPTFVPPGPSFRQMFKDDPKALDRFPEGPGDGPLSLVRVMDRIHDLVPDRWEEWKAAHPEVFPKGA